MGAPRRGRHGALGARPGRVDPHLPGRPPGEPVVCPALGQPMSPVPIPDIEQLAGLQDLDAVIDLFILDLSIFDPGRAPYRFCNWSQSGGVGLFYDGEEYEPMPVECTGFQINSNSAPSEPQMRVSNVGLTWTGLVNAWDDLVGAKLIRRRVLRRYLDDGATPSPTGHWPDEPWFIERKVAESKLTVTFALSTAFALDDVRLPKRLALRHTCSWTYRGEGCGYTGYPVADARNQPLPPPMDPALQAFYDAVALFRAQTPVVQAAEAAVAIQENAYNNSIEDSWSRLTTGYNRNFPYSFVFTYPTGSLQALFGVNLIYSGGVLIPALNQTWRRGAIRAQNFDGSAYYEIEQWQFNPGNRATALANLNSARSALAAARAVLESRRATALSLKAAADAIRDPRDQCSKTIAGCRLRFFDPLTGATLPLPTSAFPGLQIG
ncbi:minor tail protein [Cyanophage S-2L]|nr:minor tail protein [Cyanophage S-2L]